MADTKESDVFGEKIAALAKEMEDAIKKKKRRLENITREAAELQGEIAQLDIQFSTLNKMLSAEAGSSETVAATHESSVVYDADGEEVRIDEERREKIRKIGVFFSDLYREIIIDYEKVSGERRSIRATRYNEEGQYAFASDTPFSVKNNEIVVFVYDLDDNRNLKQLYLSGIQGVAPVE